MRESASRARIFSLPLQMLCGLIAGILVGLVWPAAGTALQPIGTAFIKAIGMLVIPLVFSTVALGIHLVGSDLRRLGRIAFVAFGWFYLATALLALLALALNGLFHPGRGVSLVASGQVPASLAISVDWVKFVMDLIPGNVLAVMAEQKVLPTLVFAILLGLALAHIGDSARPILDILRSVQAVMFKLIRWIVALAPAAIFALMAWLFASQGWAVVIGLVKMIAIMYLSLAIVAVAFCVIILLLGESPLSVLRKVGEPVILGFTTRSSEVTLPVHIETLERMGIPRRIVGLVLPLGYSFNLDGTILYLVLATTFLAEAYHLALSWSALVTIFVTAVVASKGVANVPSGGLVALATVLIAIGLPVEAIALIAGIDALMDMGRTAVNVFGNTVAVMLVQKWGGPVGEASHLGHDSRGSPANDASPGVSDV